MSRTDRDIKGILHHAMVPALPVPFTIERTIDSESHVRMADYMLDMPIAGVAVWAHTGRGLLMSESEREVVLRHWRDSMPTQLVIAGAGCPATTEPLSDEAYIARAREVGLHAKSLGADVVLCHPPTRFWDRSPDERDAMILEYHRALSTVGLPLILFYLYEAAGGIAYTNDVLRTLCTLPRVIGIKIATLDSVMTFQDIAHRLKAEHPELLIITGEDRFLGYSLMCGADSALIGMGSALAKLQADMMRAYYKQDFENFLYRSWYVDRFSMSTFVRPMEGYITRMLYTLSWLGIVSREATFDPWGPTIENMDAVAEFLTALPSELKR